MRCLALVAALAWGCSPGHDAGVATEDASDAQSAGPCAPFPCFDAGMAEISLAGQARKTLQGCGGIEYCHASGAGGMTLFAGGVFDATIGVPSNERPELLRVQPGEPLQSYLYLKVLCEGGILGGCMSANPKVWQLFHDWIEAGAPAN